MAITITEVAKKAGVSPSTVSRTCKNSSTISEKTKNKVRKAMDELGYQYQNAPVNNQPNTIGVIFPTFRPSTTENPFYLEAIHGISTYCNQKNISLVLHTGNTEQEVLNSVENSPAKGFIFLYSDVDDALIKYMHNTKQTFVLIGKATTNIKDTIYVDTDNVQAGKDACDYLVSLGHQRIAYIGTDKTRVFSSDRKAGYLLSLSQNQLDYHPEYVVELPTRITSDYAPLDELLAKEEIPTALIVCDDLLATAIMPVLKKHKLTVPNDISLVSFNNSLIAKLADPPLTSVDINAFQLGFEAGVQLCKHMEEPNLVATKTLIPHKLIKRDSCLKREEK